MTRSHNRDLARALQDLSNKPYSACRAVVERAAAAGKLPATTSAAGRKALLRTLLQQLNDVPFAPFSPEMFDAMFGPEQETPCIIAADDLTPEEAANAEFLSANVQVSQLLGLAMAEVSRYLTIDRGIVGVETWTMLGVAHILYTGGPPVARLLPRLLPVEENGHFAYGVPGLRVASTVRPNEVDLRWLLHPDVRLRLRREAAPEEMLQQLRVPLRWREVACAQEPEETVTW